MRDHAGTLWSPGRSTLRGRYGASTEQGPEPSEHLPSQWADLLSITGGTNVLPRRRAAGKTDDSGEIRATSARIVGEGSQLLTYSQYQAPLPGPLAAATSSTRHVPRHPVTTSQARSSPSLLDAVRSMQSQAAVDRRGEGRDRRAEINSMWPKGVGHESQQ
jgi:hypothetical protein